MLQQGLRLDNLLVNYDLSAVFQHTLARYWSWELKLITQGVTGQAGLLLTFASSLGDSLGFIPYFLIRAASCSSSIFSGGGLGAAIGVDGCLTWFLQRSSIAIAQQDLQQDHASGAACGFNILRRHIKGQTQCQERCTPWPAAYKLCDAPCRKCTHQAGSGNQGSALHASVAHLCGMQGPMQLSLRPPSSQRSVKSYLLSKRCLCVAH